MLFFISMQVTLQSGLLRGVQFGTLFTTTYFCPSPLLRSHPLPLTYGSLIPKLGICNFCLTLLTCRQSKLSPRSVQCLLISRIYFGENPPETASAPLKKSTSTCLPRTPFNSLNRALGASFPSPTTSFSVLGEAGNSLP